MGTKALPFVLALLAAAVVGSVAEAGQTTMASYYGNESGSKTASGQRFNEAAMTAAHRSYPFGTKLKVTRGSRSVVVTVNDRGPFVRGRGIDVSKGAARALAMMKCGVCRVAYEKVD